MPILVIGLIVVVLCVCLTVVYLIKTGKVEKLKRNRGFLVIFGLSLISLLISLKVFWNIAIYVDDFGASPTDIYGGNLWLSMAWLNLALLAIITFVSGIKLISK